MGRKICFVINSRANYARCKSAMISCLESQSLDLQVVVGASGLLYKYGKVIDLIKADGFSIDAEIYSQVDGDIPQTMARTSGLSLLELASTFERLKPDIVITVADRHENLSTAIAASYMNIVTAHIQGGEITGSIDETVRHATTKLSHLHFPATQNARQIILQMGEHSDSVHVTGCPAIDLCRTVPKEVTSNILKRYSGVGAEIDAHSPYLLVLQHPVTNEYLDARSQILETLRAVRLSGYQTIWLWPNVDSGSDAIAKALREFREKNLKDSKIRFFRNFSAEDYVNILRNSACVVGNSSSGIREANYLGTPSISIGSRQMGREHGSNAVFVDPNFKDIEDAIGQQISHGAYTPDLLFGDGHAGERICKILESVELNTVKKFQRLF